MSLGSRASIALVVLLSVWAVIMLVTTCGESTPRWCYSPRGSGLTLEEHHRQLMAKAGRPGDIPRACLSLRARQPWGQCLTEFRWSESAIARQHPSLW